MPSSIGVVVIGGGGVDLEPVGVEPLDLLCQLQRLLLPHALVGQQPALELWLRGPWRHRQGEGEKGGEGGGASEAAGAVNHPGYRIRQPRLAYSKLLTKP